MIGKTIIFREYFLFYPLEIEGKIVDKCKTFFGDKYLVQWWSEKPARFFFELIKPEKILRIIKDSYKEE